MLLQSGLNFKPRTSSPTKFFGAGVSGSINGLRKAFHRKGFASCLPLFSTLIPEIDISTQALYVH